MTPTIYDALTFTDSLPKEFNSFCLCLNGRLHSDFKWTAELERAKQLISEDKKIFWELDLGLFSDLKCPLDDEMQCRSLKLALDVFSRDVWEAFKESSIGLCLYRGTADFTLDYPWPKITKEYNHHERLSQWLQSHFDSPEHFNRETNISAQNFEELNYRTLLQTPEGKHLLNLFCRNVVVDYLNLLTEHVPDDIPLYLLIDAFPEKNPAYLAQLLSQERFHRYHLAIRGGSLPLMGMAWDDDRATMKGYISRREIPPIDYPYATTAICLPPEEMVLPKHYRGLKKALLELNRRHYHYRIIPEPFLTMEWEGLDFLFYIPEGLSDLGARKLQGFCAAGGTVITLGEKTGLPQELSFDEWAEKVIEIL